MNDTEIIWEEPPPTGGVWAQRIAPFLDRPGEWGRLRDDISHGTTHDLRLKVRRGALPAGLEFRETAKGARPGRAYLFVRYTPTEDH